MKNWIPWIATALLVTGGPAAAAGWESWADFETIEVVTTNEDGSDRETTIWVVVIEGTAFIRTSESTEWGNAVDKAETIGLRGGGEARTVRATAITDTGRRDQVTASFREKYGFQDRLVSILRGEARIWSVEPISP